MPTVLVIIIIKVLVKAIEQLVGTLYFAINILQKYSLGIDHVPGTGVSTDNSEINRTWLWS